MTTYKYKDINTSVDKDKTIIEDNGTAFYTEDKGTTALRLFIKWRDQPFNLDNTTMKPVLDLFHSDGSIWRNEPLEVINTESGLVQYKIPNNVIAHAGNVRAKLFLKNTEQSVHVANFDFIIKDSGIEGAIEKEISVNLVEDTVRRIIKENAIEILGDDFEQRLNTDVINHLDSNPEMFKGEDADNEVIAGLIKDDVAPITSEVIQAREGFPLLKDRINSGENEIETNLNSRGVLATQPPKGYQAVVGDGITDNTEALNKLIYDFSHVVLPPGEYIVKDTIIIGRNGKSLVGVTDTTRGFNKTAIIKYDGLEDNRKTVVLMGRNNVGEEPVYDGTNNQIKNINIDCNYKAGFGIYATYFTNESEVNNITVKGSLEYNFYFAKAWYGTIKRLVSLNCKNVGIAIGVPLVFLDGTEVIWTSSNNLEMNNLFIRDLRSLSSGEYFSKDSTIKFNPTTDYKKGYGLAIGVGNSMNVDNITVEKSGGVNLYCLTGTQPVKSIDSGYMEKPCYNSNLPEDKLVNIFIEHLSQYGSCYEIKNIYIMPNSGGILFKGEKRPVKLVNIQSPSFLKSWENVHEKLTLYSIVLKNNVHYNCGYYNYDEREFVQTYRGKHNTRYSFEVDLTSLKGKFRVVFVKLIGDKAIGAMKINNSLDNTSYDAVFPTNINKENFVFSHIQSGIYDSITKSGNTESVDGTVEFMIYDIPMTYIG